MDKTEIIATIVLFNFFFILFIIGIILFIKQYKVKKNEHNKILIDREKEHQKELLSNKLEIQNQTMQHIGREIHDNIGQQLTLASIYSQKFSFENGASGANENIENISSIINQSLVDLRQLSKTLTNDTIDQNSIQELIDNECKKVNNLKNCTVSFIKESKITLDSYQTKSILLRIVQEFLQNSIKHSKCKNITILLKEIDNNILLQLQDDGIGFQVDELISNGIGLSNMKKRTYILNGTFELESQPNLGTKLVITIPL